jgi:hypothetical protein
MAGGFWKSFKAVGNGGTFEMKPYWQKIHPKLSDDAKGQLIKSLTLYLVNEDGTKKDFSESRLHGKSLLFSFSKNLAKKLKPNKGSTNTVIFLSVQFKDEFKILPGFKEYDYDSRWNIQIEIFNRVYEEGLQAIGLRCHSGSGMSEKEVIYQMEALKPRKDENRLEDLAIRRHKKFGEVPYFDWRSETNPREYSYQLKKKKT